MKEIIYFLILIIWLIQYFTYSLLLYNLIGQFLFLFVSCYITCGVFEKKIQQSCRNEWHVKKLTRL